MLWPASSWGRRPASRPLCSPRLFTQSGKQEREAGDGFRTSGLRGRQLSRADTETMY